MVIQVYVIHSESGRVLSINFCPQTGQISPTKFVMPLSGERHDCCPDCTGEIKLPLLSSNTTTELLVSVLYRCLVDFCLRLLWTCVTETVVAGCACGEEFHRKIFGH